AALRPLWHFGVASHLAEGAQKPLHGNVKHAVAHHEGNRGVTGPQQRRQVLTGKVTGERLPVGPSIGARLLDVPHRSAHRDELEVLTFALVAPFETDADHSVSTKRIGL